MIMARTGYIHIVGDPPLRDEYAALVVKSGFACNPRIGSARPRKDTLATFELTNTDVIAKRKRLAGLDRSLPDDVPLLSSSVAVTVDEQSTWIRNPQRLVGIGALPSLLEGSVVEIARGKHTDTRLITKAAGILSSLGKEAVVVQDAVGLVIPRILCMLVNEAFFAMGEGVSEGPEIDTAMRLGTNYPRGPVEYSRTIGLDQVRCVLTALHAHFGEDRYRIAPALLREAF
jgi:3-hydroxybutyryl-CoA dehydrogenase